MTPKEQIEEFIDDTESARRLSQKCRDYYDSRQWTEREVQILERRSQAAITVNRIRPKVEGLKGLYELRKSDPKAFPRTQKHAEAATVVTDALRYVADNNDFQMTRIDVAEEFFIEGYGGVFIDVAQKNNEVEIRINHIPWDRIYFDPHSRRKDFKDSRFMGLWMWMDEDVAKDIFNLSDAQVKSLHAEIEVDGEQTNEDRPKWSINNHDQHRLRIAMHFHIEKSVWKMTIFSGDTDIRKTQDSPFKDEDGFPMNPIELVSANIDRENRRYGEVKAFLSQQDEINHRRSKALHYNSSRQTYGNESAITDIPAMKNELKKPDGHIQIAGDGQLGKDFGILDTNQRGAVEFNFYQDAKDEMDRNSFSAPLSGNTDGKDISGVALDKLQQGSSLELNAQYALLTSWEKRVHTQSWARVKQFWNEEKWIRITDNQEDLRWVGLNSQVTAQQMLIERSEDQSLPLEETQDAKKLLDFLVQTQNPRLNEVVDVRNETAFMDVDIIIDQSFDVVNSKQALFETLMQFAQGSDIDILELLELSQVDGSKELIEKIQNNRAAASQAQQQVIAVETQKTDVERGSKVEKERAETANVTQDTVNKKFDDIVKQAELSNLLNNPDDEVQVSI